MIKQGLVIILVCVFANQSSAKTYARGNKLIRFLNDNVNSGIQCGPYYCAHGSCRYQHMNGASNLSCICHNGWHGEQCDQSSRQNDHCHNRCGEHGICELHHTYNGTSYWRCTCDQGWHGYNCAYQYTNEQTPCHNTYCVNGICVYNKDNQGHQWNYHCTCYTGWHGIHCDQTISTTTRKQTSEPTTSLTATLQTVLPKSSAVTMPQFFRCSHTNTITAIALQTNVTNQYATPCPSGDHASHEAFVLTECNVAQTPSSWQQGVNVIKNCASIPDLTPIASFDNGLYSSVGSLSGVFLGCTNDGFKIAFQTCGQTPHISELHIGGSFSENPIHYYTIA